MNTEGCPPGLFTDEIVLYYPSAPCSQSISTWLGIALFCAICRTFVAVPHYITIARKLKRRAERGRKGSQFTARAALRVFVELLAGLLQLLFVLLTSLNLASTRNGLGPMLFSLFLLPIVFGQLLDVKVVVKLGGKIIPFALPKPATGAGVTTRDNVLGVKLNQFDFVLKFAGAIAIASVVLAMLFVAVLGPIFPNQSWTLRAGLGFMLGYICFLSIAMIWHLQRCLHAIHVLCMNAASDRKIQATIRTFKVLQIMIAVFSMLSAVLIVLLIANVLPFYWPVLVAIFMAGELLFQLGSVVSMFTKKQKSSSTNTTSDDAAAANKSPLTTSTSKRVQHQTGIVVVTATDGAGAGSTHNVLVSNNPQSEYGSVIAGLGGGTGEI